MERKTFGHRSLGTENRSYLNSPIISKKSQTYILENDILNCDAGVNKKANNSETTAPDEISLEIYEKLPELANHVDPIYCRNAHPLLVTPKSCCKTESMLNSDVFDTYMSQLSDSMRFSILTEKRIDQKKVESTNEICHKQKKTQKKSYLHVSQVSESEHDVVANIKKIEDNQNEKNVLTELSGHFDEHSVSAESNSSARKLRRAISETKSPLEHVRMTRQLLEIRKEKTLQEQVLYKDEKFHLNIIEDGILKLDRVSSREIKPLVRSQMLENHDEWPDKLRRKKMKVSRCKSAGETEGNNCKESLIANQSCASETPSKSKNKKKQIKRSISLSFNRLKQFSNTSSRAHQKFENEFSSYDLIAMGHETSRRKNCISSINDLDERPFEVLQHESRRQSLSCPNHLDREEDENITDLYLPRRMAICPDLSVPAMKQLKTYLILTRLKQYCFV